MTRTPAKPGYGNRNWAITPYGRYIVARDLRKNGRTKFAPVADPFPRAARTVRVTELGRKMLEAARVAIR